MTESAAQIAQETPTAITATETPTVEAKQAAQTEKLFDGKTEASPKVETKVETPEAKPAAKETANTEKPVETKFELKLPEGTQLKAADLEKIASIAKERGFTPEQAQALVDAKHEALSEYVTKQQQDIKQKAQVEWVNESKNDKEIGGEAFGKNVELAKRVVERFGTDQFKKALNETGLGNHPELLRVFARIGKSMADDQLVTPGTQTSSSSKRSAEDVLFGGGKN